MSDSEDLRNPGVRIPDLSLPEAGDGLPMRLRQGRRAPIVVLLHAAGCARCREDLQAAVSREAELAEWSGRLLGVLPARPGPQEDVEWTRALPVPVLVDEDARISRAAGVEPPAVIVADQWGEVHEAAPAGADHDFVPLDRVISTARFLSVRCPECEGESL